MRKLVVLKLDGNLDLGVRVTLEIGLEGDRPSTEITGSLPPNPDMLTAIDQWQSTYRSLGTLPRIKAKKIIYDGSISQRREDCQNLASQLRKHLNHWLQSESFRPIQEKLLKHLMPSDEVRVVIRTPCPQLKKLPWHLWDLVDRDYQQAEVTLSVLESEQVPVLATSTKKNKVKILAILGNSDGIDVQPDRQLLEKLPGAAITFLNQPKRQDINDQLWNQPWNILFFAGHSKTEDGTGRIYINETQYLTIDQLKYALRNAVANGLQLAIFNSCDGLGLARSLQFDLHIPQIIVMREPVPDLVAQEFLKHFLEAFSSGQSLYAAVRFAREKLEGLESEYPSASWLPVICEHPTVAPLTWPEPRILHRRRLGTLLLLSLLVTANVLGVRHLGGWQTWELQAFDQLMRSRPESGQDPRLLIVTVTEDDLHLPEQQHRIGSLSDLALARLLEKLTQLQPRTIGLDIYRDFPVTKNQPSLATRLKTAENFFEICKVRDSTKNDPGASPPPEVPPPRLGFSDVVPDADKVLRRHLLAMKPAPTSPCTAPYALSAQLAFQYLEKEGISAKYIAGELQLGNVVLKRWRSHMGGYQQVDTEGYQILLNYRSYRHSPLEIAPTVTLTEVLKGAVKPEFVKDKIVLIGTTVRSFRDYIPIPYYDQQGSQEMPGVILQAQMVSQIVSAVKDGRPLLTVLPAWGDMLWVWGWSVIGGAIAWRCGSGLYLILAGGGALLVLYVLCLVLLCQGSWVPLVPSALVLVFTGGIVAIYLASESQRQLISHNLRYD
ncbi:MAG: CHASE2 domain-containing protein [Stigonema ocellatum SAG 48.90 = DSM 106950]|nr:CHASE2 domain-containing protein [Stigonema ocellatum SAG 48.90 = DSM 106950]